MQRKLSVLAAMMAVTASAFGQSYSKDYVAFPTSASLPSYVTQWKNGSLKMEDENFFISRVKPKARFRNIATQVNQSLTANNDKRLVYWVPVGDMNSDNGCNALPNGVFDSEVFSMWSYVDHYGDWSAPHGWVPGNFADVAHKNGVGVSGVASTPNASLSGDWMSCFQAQAALKSDDIASFLYYHGVDGLGYNSEFWGGATYVQAIAKQHGDIVKYLEERGNPVAEHIWYDGTGTDGSIHFDQGLGTHNQDLYGVNGERRSSLFFNYNWNRNSNLGRSVTKANELNVDPRYIYAGFNMQGNNPGTNNWVYLNQNNVSIGLWGAHANNMFWAGRNSGGSNPNAMQRTYQTTIERFFSNGPQNPAIELPVVNGPCNQGVPSFFGMSALKTAKSSLSWDLTEEPFITYFNLGNGKFFNWEGKRANNCEWYNIGVQDYLPTWRYWWAPSLLGRGVKEGDVKLNAKFSWDDAFMGGSCLQITGTQSETAYLHLFKTQFTIQRGDVFTFTYKLNRGTASKVSLVFSTEGAETTAIDDVNFVLVDSKTEADDETWVTKTVTLNRGAIAASLNGKTIAMVALKIEGASDLDLNLGQFAIRRGATATPAAPQITLARVLKHHYKGVDAKLIWNMASSKAAGEPVYNTDVNTSVFKLYVQEEGSEAVLCGMTTSWAGLYYSAPVESGTSRVRFGVSAVATDFGSESEIAWSDWQGRGDYTSIDDIQISKTTLKPGEGFTVSYVDPKHAPANWTIYNSDGKLMGEAKNALEITVENGFDQIGGYDVVLNEGTTNERRYGYFIQVSSPETGAWPEIYTLSVDKQEVTAESDAVTIEPAHSVELAYTGRDADGAGSRGVQLSEHPFGVRVGELGITDTDDFSVAGWIKLTSMPEGTNSFLTIETRNGSWPANNWGYFWARITGEGKFVSPKIDTGWGMRLDISSDSYRLFNQYDDSKVGLNAWTHFVITFEHGNSKNGKPGRRTSFYLNGVKQTMSTWIWVNKGKFENYTGNKWYDLSAGKSLALDYGENSTESCFAEYSYAMTANDWITFGGTAHEITAVDGVIDDFQIWKKTMTAEDVKASMAGLNPNNLPAEVVAYWDFESDPASDYGFEAVGSKKGAKAYLFDFAKEDNEGQAGKVYVSPSYEIGCPFISGTSYKVETVPTWTAKRATVTNAEGTATEGHATMSWKAEGDYNVTLTLTNGHGSDSRTFPVFTVKDESGLDETVANADAQAYTVDGTLMVEVAGNEAYTVSVANTAGQIVASRSVAAGAERMMRIDLRSAGVYVVTVTTDGGATRTFKLLSK